MTGAAVFTLALIAVLVGATYLLQFAIWLFAFALVAVVWAVQAVLALAWCVWWVFDRKAAMTSYRQVNATC